MLRAQTRVSSTQMSGGRLKFSIIFYSDLIFKFMANFFLAREPRIPLRIILAPMIPIIFAAITFQEPTLKKTFKYVFNYYINSIT